MRFTIQQNKKTLAKYPLYKIKTSQNAFKIITPYENEIRELEVIEVKNSTIRLNQVALESYNELFNMHSKLKRVREK